MVDILKTDSIKYQCNCGVFKSIFELCFCRKCSSLKCRACYIQEVDLIYCGMCFENITISEARESKLRCQSCYSCPICDCTLTLVTLHIDETEKFKLVCPNCRYSTLNAGLPLAERPKDFALFKPTDTSYFDKIRESVRADVKLEQENREKIIQLQSAKKRRTLNLSDRYGLASAYASRTSSTLMDTTNNELDTTAKELTELEIKDVKLSDNLNYNKIMTDFDGNVDNMRFPIPKKLQIRTLRKCDTCNSILQRGDYNPASINYRAKNFAYYYVPYIELASPIDFVVNEPQPGFFCISNHASFPLNITLKAIDVDDNYVKCSTSSITTTLPISTVTNDIDDHLRSIEAIRQGKIDTNNIVFKSENIVGIHLNLTSKKVQENNYLLLELSYDSVIPTTPTDKGPTTPWNCTHQIRIDLGSSRKSKENEDAVQNTDETNTN